MTALRKLLQNGGAALGVGGVVVLWVGVWHSSKVQHDQAMLGAMQETRNLSRAFEESVLRTVKSVDQSLLFIREAYRKNPKGFDVIAFAQETQALTDVAFQMSRISRDGILASSNFAPDGRGIDLSDREHFQVQRDSHWDDVFISKPVVGRASGMASIQMTRKLFAADGTFDGVIVISIDPHTFSRFYDQVDLGRQGLVVLAGADGTIRAAELDNAPSIATSLTGSPVMQEFAHTAIGTLVGRSGIDDVVRVESYRAVRGLPLMVVIGIAEADVLTEYRANLRQDIEVAGLLSMVLLMVTGLLLRRQVGLNRARAALGASRVRLSEKSEKLRTTLEAMSQGILMVNAQREIQLYNQRALDLVGRVVSQVEGAILLARMSGYMGDIDALEADAKGMAVPGGAAPVTRDLVHEHQMENGVLLEVRTRALTDGGLVQTYSDITAWAAAELMLETAIGQDHLTGLNNRHSFGLKLDAGLAAAKHNDHLLHIICIDLDHFKKVNDTCGHGVGDNLLRMVAKRMRALLRAGDVVARLGGDEFSIILSEQPAGSAEFVVQKLIDSLALPYAVDGETIRIGASIGIASYPQDGTTAEVLMHSADTALYEAKGAGRNLWRRHAVEDGLRERQRVELASDFRASFERRQFTLAYQPICLTTTGEKVGFEALLRWKHPNRGVIAPQDFLPIAEEAGLIVELSRWVLETACAEAAGWPRPLRIAVNVSPAWFHAADLLEHVANVLQRTGLAPGRLELEVTETVLLKATLQAVETIAALRRLGIRLVLDGFGSSHASLSYLRGLPFDQVKIDRSFMRALNSDRQARALVKAMLAMACALGLDVVAEGVETPEQLILLRHLQCTLVQGYLLGMPVTASQARLAMWEPSTLENDLVS